MSALYFAQVLVTLLCFNSVMQKTLGSVSVGDSKEDISEENVDGGKISAVSCTNSDGIDQNTFNSLEKKRDLKLEVLRNVIFDLKNDLTELKKVNAEILKKIPMENNNINEKFVVLERKIASKLEVLEKNLKNMLDFNETKIDTNKETNYKLLIEDEIKKAVENIPVLGETSDSESVSLKPEEEFKISRKLNISEASIIQTGCKRYEANKGYSYSDVFPLNYESLRHVGLKKNNGGITFLEMHFAVKSARDGIIMLSPISNPSLEDLIFEIGIGTSRNRMTTLGLRMNNSEVRRLNTYGILSTDYYVPFYIKISDGLLEFGVEGGDSPLITYYNRSLRTIRYFGFTSWGTNKAKFLYDCPASFNII